MEILVSKFLQQLQLVSVSFVRSVMQEINWEARLIGIKGARGIGKTTLLLQYIKQNLSDSLNVTLYVSLDSVWFSNKSIVALADEFVRKGGKYLFLDEVHKYPNWAQELKNIYDEHPTLKVVFTGSSLLEILNSRADLSRRAVIYTMQGFSLREFISLESGFSLPVVTLLEILENHLSISMDIVSKVKPLVYFEKYLKYGYYPFYREQQDLYPMRLSEVINMILEVELPLLRNIDVGYVRKIKQLLLVVAESAPFVPNVSKLSEKIEINRATLLTYLFYLEEVGLTRNLYKQSSGTSRLQKPDKIYLENSNLIYLLASDNSDKGSVRETFFANQLAYRHQVEYADRGDFFLDNKFTFEVGGKSKGKKQVSDISYAYIVSDDIEYGFQNKIPLWLFGFMY